MLIYKGELILIRFKASVSNSLYNIINIKS
jgi:hypothetical protein